MSSLASLLSYGAVRRLKGDGGKVSSEAMDAIMAIDVAEVSAVSAAVGDLLQWVMAIALKEPPSPDKAGMLVHTLAGAE